MIMDSSSSFKSLRFISHQSFFASVRSNDIEQLKLIFSKEDDDESIKALMSMQNEGGETALYIAAEANFEEVFGFLLKFCDVEVVKIRSKADFNAFHIAAERGHLGNLSRSYVFLYWYWFKGFVVYLIFELLMFPIMFRCFFFYGIY